MRYKKDIQELKLVFPQLLLKDAKLSPLDRFLLAIIIAFDNKDGCFATNKSLARFVNCSTASISNSIRKLMKLGYVIENIDLEGRGYRRKVDNRLKEHKRQD